MNTSRNRITVQNNDRCTNNFTVLTYNILADCHVLPIRNESYHFVNDDHLLKNGGAHSKRHLLLMKELSHFNTDIMLLQEVEHWYSPILQSELQKLGYSYNFLQKTGVPEGSVLCYKTDKFQCLKTVELVLHDEVKRICKDLNVPQDVIDMLEKPNVSLIQVLRNTTNGKTVICATTHIVYEEFRDPAIQCMQACMTCMKINDVRMEISSNMEIDVKDISVVFGGDFNGEPTHMSVQLMKSGQLSDTEMKTLEHLKYMINERKAKPIESPDECYVSKYLSKYLRNPLKLSSVYNDVTGSEPNVTSAENSYVGCLDYIFYTDDLRPLSVIHIDSSIEELYRNGGPTEEFASDHLPLVAEFSYS